MKSLQRALHAASFDPLLARLFAEVPWDAVAGLAAWLASADPYREGTPLTRALRLVGGSEADVREHLTHQMWCAWRQAASTARVAEPLEVRVEGRHWLTETAGHPTVIVAPMTLSTPDALQAIIALEPDRQCIVFGEDVAGMAVAPWLEVVSEGSAAPVRRILRVLEGGGLFLTYPDFVYGGRTSEETELFGRPRPLSSGYVSIAARDDTMLLPVVCLRSQGGLLVRVEEAHHVRCQDADAGANRFLREQVARLIGGILESLIRIAPVQWRLLPTLTFDAPQLSARRPAGATASSPAAGR